MKKTLSVRLGLAINGKQSIHSAELDLRTGGVLVIYDESIPSLDKGDMTILVEDMEVGVITSRKEGLYIHGDDLDDIITTLNG